MTKHDPNRATEILGVIEDFTRENGYAPSVREIAVRVGLASTSAVHHHLSVLVKDGRLIRSAGRARAVIANAPPSDAESILRDVMFDKHVGELDIELQDRIGRYFATPRRKSA